MSSLGENDDGEVLEQIASLARRRVLVEFERCELAGDLEDWVGPWFGDEALRERLARHVADGKGVARLRNFLDAAVADELHDELAGTTDWERRAEARPKYQYRFDALSDHRPARFFHASRPTLRRLYGFFNAPAAKTWAERLLRAAPGSLDADTTVMATRYGPGCYTSLHSDASARRRLAFVLHLARDWPPERGGDLVFVDPVAICHAEFNTLLVFAVGDDANWHMVTPVVAGDGRFAVTGWFNSEETPAAAPRGDHPTYVLDVDVTRRGGGAS